MFRIRVRYNISKQYSKYNRRSELNNYVFNCSNLVDAPGEKEAMYLEKDILPTLAGTDQVIIFTQSVRD